MKLDLENDEAEIFGHKIPLDYTTSGHYCVPVDKLEETKVEEVCKVNLEDLGKAERLKVLDKLHKQFVHPSKKRLIALMEDAGVWRKEFDADLETIHNRCHICKLYAKTPARPIVSIPMATSFNEKVAMDLKPWKDGKNTLHMVDMFSRFECTGISFCEEQTTKRDH